jgi:deoxyribodipyrimidine photo-lyase
MFNRSLFIFRRDLRLRDNTGLSEAMRQSKSVLPIFIVDPAIINRYAAEYRKTFLSRSLEELDREIQSSGGKLSILEDNPQKVLVQLMKNTGIDAVFVNKDYTPISRHRDARLHAVCSSAGIPFFELPDQLLNEPEHVAKNDGSPYTVFTPFYRKAKGLNVREPLDHGCWHFSSKAFGELATSSLRRFLGRSLVIQPGLSGATEAMAGIESLDRYGDTRDLPGCAGTTHLSAHLRFGTCSIRQVFQSTLTLREPEVLQRQLYWRDFYHHIGYHFPHVYEGSFRRKYDQLLWSDDPNAVLKWRQGKTGFPIVDAGMRELAATGYMHNRARMIVASFLTKNLHINWKKGEEHFAELLIDFDPAINNGNWQWSASTGCDSQPYFRVFNPWLQQKKFDPQCRYITRWLPELDAYPPKEIHGLEKRGDFYLPQITDLKISAEESKRRFKTVV